MDGKTLDEFNCSLSAVNGTCVLGEWKALEIRLKVLKKRFLCNSFISRFI